ncbi:MAG TPA: helix-turn-helix transcriptional regulator, partial [Candidatus Coprovivens excrementavium]|nr:helix-turn-helix transcriptional regulator [Candidatus Coprovivens excrementavium]
MELKKDFAELITSARKSKKMTQQELSALINVSDKAISNWETGKNIPDYEILKKLEKILDISLFNEPKEKRYFKYLIIIPLIFLIILFIYFIFNYNKVNYYTVTLDSEDFVLYDSTILKIDKEYIIDL